MNEEQKLQRLLRLKRHESPPDGYFDDFLSEFHQRQRQEILKGGSLSLLWERIQTWVDGMRRPAVAWSLAGVYAVTILLICMWPKPGPSGTVVALGLQAPPASTVAQPAIPPPPNRDRVLVNNPATQAVQQPGKTRTVDPNGNVPFIGDERPAPPPAEDQPEPPPVQGTLREL